MTIAVKDRPTRLRRDPGTVRTAAVASARRLLIARGPEALTLPLVARDLGMTHGNLTHHFGTVAALHAALIAAMAADLARIVEAAAPGFRSGAVPARHVVDLIFDAFAEGGAGRLAAWLAATDRLDGLQPMFATIAASVLTLRAGEAPGAEADGRGAGAMAASLLTSALGAALIGAPLQEAAGLRSDDLRRLASDTLERLRATPLPQRSGGIA